MSIHRIQQSVCVEVDDLERERGKERDTERKTDTERERVRERVRESECVRERESIMYPRTVFGSYTDASAVTRFALCVCVSLRTSLWEWPHHVPTPLALLCTL